MRKWVRRNNTFHPEEKSSREPELSAGQMLEAERQLAAKDFVQAISMAS
jgi:hypothetical protein